MSEKKYQIKTNKNHGGKEFTSFFHFVGRVEPVQRQEENSWVEQPIFEQTKTKDGKPMRRLVFQIETAKSNRLRVELFAMEQEFAYPYSKRHNKVAKVKWKDRNNKEKYPDNTYHLIETDWDKIERLSKIVEKGKWVEVKGKYDPDEYTNQNGVNLVLRRLISDVKEVNNGDEIEVIENGDKKKVKYVCDFDSPEFVEINKFNMQIGIRSTYHDEDTKDTKINATYLVYGKDRSEPKDVELIVHHKPAPKGKKSLAEALAGLEKGDFIEVTGKDNNRAVFSLVEVEEDDDEAELFGDVDDSAKQTKKVMVASGTEKGLEVTGYVKGSLMRGLLSDEEMEKSFTIEEEAELEVEDDDNDDFDDLDDDNDDDDDVDELLDISDDDLPF